MVTQKPRHLAAALAFAAGLTLAGCNTDSIGSGNLFASLSGKPEVPPAPAAPAAPPADMAGHWRLVSATGQSCDMNFTAPQGASQGAVAPAGGCPGNFFTTRHWSFEQDSLALLDHKNKQLVQMKRNSVGRFEGETGTRELVWLER